MPDRLWTPSLDDTDTDAHTARLRAAVCAAVPELIRHEPHPGGRRPPHQVEITLAPGIELRLVATRMRRITRHDRPVLELRFRGSVRSQTSESRRPTDLPIAGVCLVDLATGAILHLEL